MPEPINLVRIYSDAIDRQERLLDDLAEGDQATWSQRARIIGHLNTNRERLAAAMEVGP